MYDIFWVFLSERFFGSNVMVAAATKQVGGWAGVGAWVQRAQGGGTVQTSRRVHKGLDSSYALEPSELRECLKGLRGMSQFPFAVSHS